MVLNAAGISADLSAALSNKAQVNNLRHHGPNNLPPVIGTIRGQVTRDSTGKGFGQVRVELIDSNGNVVKSTFTNARGQYTFTIRENGPYVVREVTPKHFVQTTPTFANTEPKGTLIPPYGNGSWSYSTGNSNPAFGPVGPYSWDTIAPAGDFPFQSPINITGPTTDLSRVLSIDYHNAVPAQIINNSHQIQVQFPVGNPNDSIAIGDQVFNLTQFHYHDPSEMTVDGHGYSMEEHFVNTSASGGETVLAVFLQLGAHNNALDPILDAAATDLTKPNSKATITTPIDFAGLLPSSMQGWFYEGSLTTPPLSQPVNWFVFSEPITLDSQQLAAYERVAGGSGFLPNARPVQPRDGRQLNEIDYDVNFQNQSIAGLNFGLTPAPKA